MPAVRKKRVNFALPAPEARQVCVAGTFNGWDPTARPLKCDRNGVWRTWMNLPPGEYQYLFVVDGEWRVDPGCKERAKNPYGSDNSAFRV